MPTMNACRRLYEGVNIAGSFGDTWCAPAPWLRAAERRAQGHFTGIPASDEMVDNQRRPPLILFAAQPRTDPGLQILFLVHLASALQKQRLLLPIAAAGEWLLGRGHHGTLGPAISGGPPVTKLLSCYDGCSRYGLLGAMVESLPMRAATAFEAHGFEGAATLCLLGATVGRVILQPARLVVAGAVLGLAIPFAALTLIGTAGANCLHHALHAARYQGTGDPHVAVIFFALGVACLVLAHVYGPGHITLRDEPVPVAPRDEMQQPHGPVPPRAAADAAEPNMRRAPRPAVARQTRALNNNPHEQVNQFMRSAIGRFSAQPVDNDAAAQRIADRIVGDLRRYCVGAPDDSAFRGGLSTLQSFMDLTYDDAQWRPTPDYELLRFMQQASAPLRAPGLSAADAKTSAARLAEDLHRHFENEPTHKPVQSGLHMLEALMHERFGGSAPRAAETELG